MKAVTITRCGTANKIDAIFTIARSAALLVSLALFSQQAEAAHLRVMKTGLGSGRITSSSTTGTVGIDCGSNCDQLYLIQEDVVLRATPDRGSVFSGWVGDGVQAGDRTTVSMDGDRSVRAVFDLAPIGAGRPAIPPLTSFTPEAISTYLANNTQVNSAARFLKALPAEFKQNWILMSRSESLQAGTAEYPRLLLPSENARFVFTIGLARHGSYPGSHPDVIEYMQWDDIQRNFRFHEIVLTNIPAMGASIYVPHTSSTRRAFPARSRGISIDDSKCSKCHSTQNVLNLDRSTSPPRPGDQPGTGGGPRKIKVKNKPNWDAYDSWAGMMPFNRDRIYQGSVEAAAFRKLFNLWTWREENSVRRVIEQLELQPPPRRRSVTADGDEDRFSRVPEQHAITNLIGGASDGHISLGFDISPPVSTEPLPTRGETETVEPIETSYSFNGLRGRGKGSSVVRGGKFVTLHHSGDPRSDEGRGVELFDLLTGSGSNLNPKRIADELVSHDRATGGWPIDIRPIALAITRRLLTNEGNTVLSLVPGVPFVHNRDFFDPRNGMSFERVLTDTKQRSQSLPRRKADIQKINLDRIADSYLSPAARHREAAGLIQQYGATTATATEPLVNRLRQEVFRRPIDFPRPDVTAMNGIYVDREEYGTDTDQTSVRYVDRNTLPVALFRYFLEPLGVSVDKWSLGVRGRSRTYTFADLFSNYTNQFEIELINSLRSRPVPEFAPFDPNDNAQLMLMVNRTLSRLPRCSAIPTFTDVQRIFNKSCIDCHGGFGYPPYNLTTLDLSEDEEAPVTQPPKPSPRLARSYDSAVRIAEQILSRVSASENALGFMPHGGPPLSQADTETLQRWIRGSRSRACGDPHIKTVDGITYDFQAAGEFVYLRDEYLEIQVRQTPIVTTTRPGTNAHAGFSTCLAVNTAVAIRIGDNRITYQSDAPDRGHAGLQLRVDGRVTELTTRGIPLPSGARIIRTKAPAGIQIEAPGGTAIVITPGWWDSRQLWYLNIDARGIRAVQGIMGAVAPGNWLPALPDGTLMGSRPSDLQQRYQDLYGKFANAWRVTDATSLFDYTPGTSTKTFTLESWPGVDPLQPCTLPPQFGSSYTNRPAKALTLEEAEQCCADIVDEDRRANCIQDVMVTEERGFASTYILVEQIERNAVPSAPVLVFPENFKTNVLKPVTFIWNHASDADGDPISYRHYVWPVDQLPNNNEASAVSLRDGVSARNGSHILLGALVCCLLVAALSVFALKKQPRFVLVALAGLAAVVFAYYLGAGRKHSTAPNQMVYRTVPNLASGKAYFWKVIAEDANGGTVESETRRFEMR